VENLVVVVVWVAVDDIFTLVATKRGAIEIDERTPTGRWNRSVKRDCPSAYLLG
jgi:hypothetical protein